MNYVAIFMLIMPIFTWAKCSENIPDQLIEVDIKSCKTVPIKMSRLYVKDGLWESTIIKGKVVESVMFPLSSTFSAKYSIKNSDISITMSLHETKNCEEFGDDILSKEPVTLIVRKICCDAGQAYCREVKYWGYELPFHPKKVGGYKTNLNFDFEGRPDVKKYYKQRELIREMSEKGEQSGEPAT